MFGANLPMLALLLAAALATSDPRAVLVGTWEGESICTAVRPACRDEHAVYHISVPTKPANVVVMTMNKMVDGKEETMGTLNYRVDAEAKSLSSEFVNGDLHLLWTFTRSADRMVGTLEQLPDGQIIRNIRVKKR